MVHATQHLHARMRLGCDAGVLHDRDRFRRWTPRAPGQRTFTDEHVTGLHQRACREDVRREIGDQLCRRRVSAAVRELEVGVEVEDPGVRHDLLRTAGAAALTTAAAFAERALMDRRVDFVVIAIAMITVVGGFWWFFDRLQHVDKTALVADIEREQEKDAEPAEVEDEAPAGDMTREELEEYVQRDVQVGFAQRDEIIESAMDLNEELTKPLQRSEISAIVESAFVAHKKDQTSWPKTTDCDRLDKAFAALERSGIVARQNLGDCQTCGLDEIDGEMAAATERGVKVRGYTFFHEQDTERAIEGGLMLSYGAIEGGDGKTIANEIVRALKQADLEATWSGDLEQRIDITSFKWQRRR